MCSACSGIYILLQLKLHTILPELCLSLRRQKCCPNRNHILNEFISIMLLTACSITKTITLAIIRKKTTYAYSVHVRIKRFFKGSRSKVGRKMRPLFALQGYAIQLTFCWLVDDDPILNAGRVALCFLLGYIQVLLRKFTAL